MAFDRRSAGLHAWRRVGPRHSEDTALGEVESHSGFELERDDSHPEMKMMTDDEIGGKNGYQRVNLEKRSITTKNYNNMKKGEKDPARPSLYSSVQPWSSTCKIRGEKASGCRHSLSSGIERDLLESLNTDLKGGTGVLDVGTVRARRVIPFISSDWPLQDKSRRCDKLLPRTRVAALSVVLIT